jgi:hypothetical protein
MPSLVAGQLLQMRPGCALAAVPMTPMRSIVFPTESPSACRARLTL